MNSQIRIFLTCMYLSSVLSSAPTWAGNKSCGTEEHVSLNLSSQAEIPLLAISTETALADLKAGSVLRFRRETRFRGAATVGGIPEAHRFYQNGFFITDMDRSVHRGRYECNRIYENWQSQGCDQLPPEIYPTSACPSIYQQYLNCLELIPQRFFDPLSPHCEIPFGFIDGHDPFQFIRLDSSGWKLHSVTVSPEKGRKRVKLDLTHWHFGRKIRTHLFCESPTNEVTVADLVTALRKGRLEVRAPRQSTASMNPSSGDL